tara:strand:- start:166 stop:459 length:294 start_codon:yes stop_codon:yes gene_type:complete
MGYSNFIHDLIEFAPFAIYVFGSGYFLLRNDTRMLQKIEEVLCEIIPFLSKGDYSLGLIFFLWAIPGALAMAWGDNLAEAYWFIKLGQWLPGEPYPY